MKLILTIATVLLIVGAIYFGQQDPGPGTDVDNESPQVIATGESKTGGDDQPIPGTKVTDWDVFESVELTLAAYLQACHQEDSSAIEAFLDIEASYQRALDSGVIDLKSMDAAERSKVRRQFIERFRDAWTSNSASQLPVNMKLHRLEHTGSGMVRAHTVSSDALFEQLGYWCFCLKPTPGGNWKIIDCRGYTYVWDSTVHALESTCNANAPWTEPYHAFLELRHHLDRGDLGEDFWEIVPMSDAILDSSPPPELFAWALQHRAFGFFIAEDYEDALADLEAAEKLIGQTVFNLELRSSCFWNLEDDAACLQSLKQLERLCPLVLEDLEFMAWCYKTQDQPDHAIRCAEQCLAIDAESGSALCALALVLNEDSYPLIQEYIHATADPEGSYGLVLESATDWDDQLVIGWTLPLLKEDFPESELLRTYAKNQ